MTFECSQLAKHGIVLIAKVARRNGEASRWTACGWVAIAMAMQAEKSVDHREVSGQALPPLQVAHQPQCTQCKLTATGVSYQSLVSSGG